MLSKSNTILIDEPQLKTAQRVFNIIGEELAAVEAEFARQAKSNVQVVSYIGEYLRASGGKRVRPALLLLAVNASGGDARSYNVVRMAVVMEMLHTATLVHDDIIDNAETRRGASSVNARFGNQTAVLMGDWLYMSAFETSLRERSLGVLDILTSVTRKMVEGELMQLTQLGSVDTTESEYFRILECKTAYLFSACCEIGAMLGAGENDRGARVALRDFGMRLGAAFQLIDDVLDFTRTTDELGKPAGADLLEGKVTLPVIYLLEAKPEWRKAVQDIVVRGDYLETSREELCDAAESCGAIERARRRAVAVAEAAREALTQLGASKYRDALAAMPEFIVERES
ncbi:MAG: polyprenyl synthetase family protein [Pyrinomonadaceae bacterium MAG19_C2-C3]|nr:polyprenyl synthetase family protein [Pyrinomonadaceae bacterium MAG19_C2-C3]